MTNLACRHCGGDVERTSRRGRKPRYCSVDCRREAEYETRRKARDLDAIADEYRAVGEDQVRLWLLYPEYSDQVIDVVENYMGQPDARERHDMQPEVLDLILTGGFQVVAEGHDTPLPSDADIDHAELTGDWAPMLDAALHSEGMAWARWKGFLPDLRGFILQ